MVRLLPGRESRFEDDPGTSKTPATATRSEAKLDDECFITYSAAKRKGEEEGPCYVRNGKATTWVRRTVMAIKIEDKSEGKLPRNTIANVEKVLQSVPREHLRGVDRLRLV